MSSQQDLPQQIKALTFDVFGTVVDWRASVTRELTSLAASKLGARNQAPASGAGADVDEDKNASRAEALAAMSRLAPSDWSRFAQQWRDTYKHFTRSFVPGTTPWKDIDAHHLDSLRELLGAWGIRAAFDDAETRELSRAWHRLAPWPDSAEGLKLLGKAGYATSTLSNGNSSLLGDLNTFGALGFRHLISAEDFRAYKPAPEVYLGAVRTLGLDSPGQVAMVAAHLSDLQAASALGMRTVYVERPEEEDWRPDEQRYAEAREWVDIWVAEDQGGFIEVARRLGTSET